MIFLALAWQAVDAPTDARYRACLDLATSNPAAARNEAERFRLAGGGAKARQCLGLAYAQEERWRDAAIAFEAAAQEAAAAQYRDQLSIQLLHHVRLSIRFPGAANGAPAALPMPRSDGGSKGGREG